MLPWTASFDFWQAGMKLAMANAEAATAAMAASMGNGQAKSASNGPARGPTVSDWPSMWPQMPGFWPQTTTNGITPRSGSAGATPKPSGQASAAAPWQAWQQAMFPWLGLLDAAMPKPGGRLTPTDDAFAVNWSWARPMATLTETMLRTSMAMGPAGFGAPGSTAAGRGVSPDLLAKAQAANPFLIFAGLMTAAAPGLWVEACTRATSNAMMGAMPPMPGFLTGAGRPKS
jgi:hypothetical protein